MTSLELACISLKTLYPEVEYDHVLSSDEGFVDYESEEVKLESFKNWFGNIGSIDPKTFVAAGFHFIGSGDAEDSVKCVECGLHLSNWHKRHDPISIHMTFSGPACPFIKRSRYAHDILFYYNKWSLEDYPPNVIRNIKHPQFQNYELRVTANKTCALNWLPGRYFAEAGFYCRDNYDEMVCFYCDLTLNDWESYEDPWETHALLRPNCFYVIAMRGPDYSKFIKRVLRAHYPPFKIEQSIEAEEPEPVPRQEFGEIDDDVIYITRNRNSRHCVKCREKSVLFKPCDHLRVCMECALTSYYTPGNKRCCLCYQRIENLEVI